MPADNVLLLNASNLDTFPVYPYAFIQAPAVARQAGIEVICQDMLGIPKEAWAQTLQALIERHDPARLLITLRNTDSLVAQDYDPDRLKAGGRSAYFPIERTWEAEKLRPVIRRDHLPGRIHRHMHGCGRISSEEVIMSAHVIDAVAKGKETGARNAWTARLGLFALFLICEAAIFVFGSYYFDVFPTNKNLAYNLVVSTLFLCAALWLKCDKRWNTYWQIAFAFCIASVAYPFAAIFDVWIRAVLDWFAVTTDTSQGQAIEKVCETLLKVVPILALVKLSGADFGSVFLKRGNLKLGLGIGWLVFFFLAPAAFMFAAQRFTSMDALVAAVVWGLVFSMANGFMEELWLRGVFLKRFEPLLGLNGSVWLTAIIFASMHSFAFYFMPAALPFFALNTLALGLACGYLIMKSDSLWGAVIIHAASDFFLFIAVLAAA